MRTSCSVFSSGSCISLFPWFVCRTLLHFLLMSFLCGFYGLVICVSVLLVLLILVVLPSCTILCFPVPLFVILIVILPLLSLHLVTPFFVLLAVMLQITILIMMPSFIIVLIPLIRPFALLCGDFNNVVDRFVDCHGSCLFNTSQESSIFLRLLCCWSLKHPDALVSHGPEGMALLLPESILLGVCTFGSLLFLQPTCYLVHTLTTLHLICLGPFHLLSPIPPALVSGNSTLSFWRKRVILS